MSRPEVSVVMPFAGDLDAALEAARSLASLDTGPGDELILADNSGSAPAGFGAGLGVRVVPVPGERSPAHARNAGAAAAGRGWVLFLDADCRPRPGLLAAYFEQEVAADVGALAGEVAAAPGAQTLAARYGAARSFLAQAAHLEHPYRPRATAANLLVRRQAFDELGGFYEGVRAGEDTDFSWRLQLAGWRLELRPGAVVEHRYRRSLSELREQWRGYAAGRAWLARRYDGFRPRPALVRSLSRLRARLPSGARPRPGAPPRADVRSRFGVRSPSGAAVGTGSSTPLCRRAPAARVGRLDRGRFLALDALLGLEELAGLALSNRPRGDGPRRQPAPDVVLVADRFPAPGDPLAELAAALERARVEALARPEAVDRERARTLRIDYLEDDGAARRAAALALLAVRHPLRCLLDLAGRHAEGPSLLALAPAVQRLKRDRGARVQPLGGAGAHAAARRLARLAGRSLQP